jgi:hypothetical protein
MSEPENPTQPEPARRFTRVRMIRLALLVALGVAGYALYQLAPAWFESFSGRETALLRRNAAILFVDALLIAYPLTLFAAVSGAVVLVFLRLRARSLSHRRRSPGLAKTLWQARLLLLCCSTLLGLAVFEAGAAAWRICRRSPRRRNQPERAIGTYPMERKVPGSPADSRARERLPPARLDPCEFW